MSTESPKMVVFGSDEDTTDWAAYGREAFLQNWRKRAERAEAQVADTRRRAEAAEAEVDRLSGNLSQLLWHLTSGKMSKTTYDVTTMLLAIEDEFENGGES